MSIHHLNHCFVFCLLLTISIQHICWTIFIKAMAALFDVGTPAINKHLANIFAEGELKKEATVSKKEIV